MKLFLLLVAVFGAAQAAPAQRGLVNDVMDFVTLIPLKEIQAVFEDYQQNDPECQAIFNYAWSVDLQTAIGDIYALPGTKDLVEWVLRHLFGDELKQNQPIIVVKRHAKGEPGWNGFLQAVFSVVPVDDVLILAMTKISEQGTFYEFLEKLQSMQDHYEQMTSLPSVVLYLGTLRDLGVDVDAVDDLIRSIFGWS